MTDAYTDELFGGALPGVPAAVFPVSRLVVDPERFDDDSVEPMAELGMGGVYERSSTGTRLRAAPTDDERAALLDRFYHPHHDRLTALVAAALRADGRCLVLDGHSFPSTPLPYEPDQDPDRPDICIGTDDFHPPEPLRDKAIDAFTA